MLCLCRAVYEHIISYPPELVSPTLTFSSLSPVLRTLPRKSPIQINQTNVHSHRKSHDHSPSLADYKTHPSPHQIWRIRLHSTINPASLVYSEMGGGNKGEWKARPINIHQLNIGKAHTHPDARARCTTQIPITAQHPWEAPCTEAGSHPGGPYRDRT